MKLDSILPLPADWPSVQALLVDLDRHLVLRTYLDGYALGDLEAKIWVALRSHGASYAYIRRGASPNLTRWFNYIAEQHPEIAEEIKAKEAAKKAEIVEGSKRGANYSALQLPGDLTIVRTRFAPEPSGYVSSTWISSLANTDHCCGSYLHMYVPPDFVLC
jgi:glutamyl-tRNA synthetase